MCKGKGERLPTAEPAGKSLLALLSGAGAPGRPHAATQEGRRPSLLSRILASPFPSEMIEAAGLLWGLGVCQVPLCLQVSKVGC